MKSKLKMRSVLVTALGGADAILAWQQVEILWMMHSCGKRSSTTTKWTHLRVRFCVHCFEVGFLSFCYVWGELVFQNAICNFDKEVACCATLWTVAFFLESQ